jgi:hypothetical protein
MSLGSDAGFNADSKYEYRPQPLAATQGLRCTGPTGRNWGASAPLLLESLVWSACVSLSPACWRAQESPGEPAS